MDRDTRCNVTVETAAGREGKPNHMDQKKTVRPTKLHGSPS